MSLLDRRSEVEGVPGDDLPGAWRVATRRLTLAAALLAGLPVGSGRADTLPEVTSFCGGGHFYENESSRAVELTVQVFNGCSGLNETIEIIRFAPGVANEIVTEVRERATVAVSFRVVRGGGVQVRGPGGNGELRSSFSVR
jgi:hypothetical protein